MNRGNIRDLLRRRLNEPTSGGRWTNAQYNDLINTAYGLVQAQITVSGAPEYNIRVDRTNLVKDQTEYSWPVAMMYPLLVRIKNTTTGKYEMIDRANLIDVLERLSLNTTSDTVCYAHYGRALLLDSPPAATVSSGLEVICVPFLSMGDDNDTPKVLDAFVQLIVIQAELLARGETSDAAEALLKEREALYAALSILSGNGGQGQRLQPAVDKGY